MPLCARKGAGWFLMPRTKLEIINLALIALGEAKITAVTDDRKAADHANLVYDQARQSVLRSANWNFAIRRVSLSTASTEPAWGSISRYPLPADCLRVLRLQYGDDWSVEGRTLLTGGTPNISYIADIEDPDLFDSLFTEAFRYRIAAELAITLFGDGTRRKQMEDLYQERLMEARHKDALEASIVTIGGSSWLDARYTYDGGEAHRPISEV